jgi:hypothetical protein
MMHLREALETNNGTAVNRSLDPGMRVAHSGAYVWEQTTSSYDVHAVSATTGVSMPRYMHVTLDDAQRYVETAWTNAKAGASFVGRIERLDPTAWE